MFAITNFKRLTANRHKVQPSELAPSAKSKIIFIPVLAFFLIILTGLSVYLKVSNIGFYNNTSIYENMFYYQKVTLVPNYASLGFIRRGFSGTIARILSRDFQAAGIRLHIVSLISLALAWAILILQLGNRLHLATLAYVAAVIALSPQTFRGWALDIARSDMLVMGVISWAVIATLKGHRVLGILLIQCAQLAHELGAVFGYPLLFVLHAQAVQAGILSRKEVAKLSALALVGSAAIIALQALYGSSPEHIAAYIFQNAPASSNPSVSIDRDLATYYLVSGIRGVRAAICFNLKINHQYFITVAAGFLTVVAYAIALGLQRNLLAVAGAALFPFIFMCLIATDTGRWIKMSVANTWLLVAGMTILGTGTMVLTRRVIVVGCGALAVLFALGPTTILDASYGIRTGLGRLGIPYPEPFDKALDACDPSWRTLLPPATKETTTPPT